MKTRSVWDSGDVSKLEDHKNSPNYARSVRRIIEKAFLILAAATAVVTLLGAIAGHAQDIIYVDIDATTGADDGTSWANAFVSLQSALAMVEAGEQIWVAEGTYLPDGGSGDYLAQFLIPAGVSLLGGFSGGEISADQRDPVLQETILSGEIGDPNTRSDNTARVVFIQTVKNSVIGRDTIVDGFTITQGGIEPDGPSLLTGGIVNDQGSPTLRNLRITHNGPVDWFWPGGGGIYSKGGVVGEANPLIENVVFEHNYALSGGGLIIDTGSPVLRDVQFLENGAGYRAGAMTSSNGQPVLEDVLFYQNSAGDEGAVGGAYHSYGDSHPILRNVVFVENSTTWYYGRCAALSLVSGFLENVHFYGNETKGDGALCATDDVTIINTSFVGNKSEEGIAAISGSGITVVNGLFAFNQGVGPIAGDNIYINSTFSSNSSTVPSLPALPCATYHNSIVWGNEVDGTCTSRFSCSIIEGGLPAGAIDDGDNLFLEPWFADPDGVDDLPGTQDDDFRLLAGSPGINAGLNAFLPPDTFDLDEDGDTTEPIPFDLDGNERIEAGTVDMGAYETSGSLPVELTSFAAMVSNQSVTLTWETASADGVAGFFIEQVYDGTESDPDEIGFVPAINSTAATSYSHRVSNLWPGVYTYRLKILDLDGSFEYSPDVTASIVIDQPFIATSIYPNPVATRGTIRLSVREVQDVSVEVFDITGRRVGIPYTGRLEEGYTRGIELDVTNMPDGVYFYRIQGSNFVKVEKLVVVR